MDTVGSVSKEGWTWLFNSTKWHFFNRETGRSICGRFLLLGIPELKEFSERSPDDCALCWRKIEKRNAA